MKKIAHAKDGIVYVNSGLNEIMFAKTKFTTLMKEPGFIYKNQEFIPWTFDYTETQNEQVYFCGKDFDGKTAYEYLNTEKSKDKKNLILKICEAYTLAEKQDIAIPVISPHGILYDGTSLLFLPEKTFDRSCANFGKEEYEYIENCWRDSAAEQKESLQYARAVLAYYGLTEELPYPANPNFDNAINISDRNFVPLEYCVNGINKDFAQIINTALSGIYCEKEFPIDTFKNELFMTKERPTAIAKKEFDNARKKYIQKKEKKLKRERAFRRNFSTFVGFAAIAVLIFICATAIINENGKKPSVIGLKSSEVTKIFYSGIHNMDTDKLLVSGKNCPEAQRYISQIPQIYVTSQMRTAYNFESGLSTPENWLLLPPDTTKTYSHVIYGLTQFKINETPSTLNIKMPTRKNHSEKLVKEDGEILKNTSEKNHKVEYYLVHTVDNMIEIEKHTDFVSLRWETNKWQIIKLDQVSYTEKLSPTVFQKDYKAAIEEHNSIEKAVDSLRKKYPWLPYQQSIDEEDERLKKQGF